MPWMNGGLFQCPAVRGFCLQNLEMLNKLQSLILRGVPCVDVNENIGRGYGSKGSLKVNIKFHHVLVSCERSCERSCEDGGIKRKQRNRVMQCHGRFFL